MIWSMETTWILHVLSKIKVALTVAMYPIKGKLNVREEFVLDWMEL